MLQLLTEATLRRVHQAALDILSHVGVRVDHDGVLGLLQERGARVDREQRVARLPEALVGWALAQAPCRAALSDVRGQVTWLEAQGPTVFWTGNGLNFGEGRERREIRSPELAGFFRLCDRLPNVDGVVAPSVGDYPPNTRDFVGFKLLAENTAKHLRPCIYTPAGVEAIVEMAQVLLDGQPLRERPLCSFGYTCLSPLHWTATALEAFERSSGHGIPVMINAEPMAGATAPVTLLGAIAQATAEALSGVTILQLLEPGRPAILNLGFAHAFDMRAGAVLTGSMENGLMQAAGAEVSRHFDLPSASWMSTESLMVDSQSAYEKMATGLMHGLAGVGIIWGVGNLESTVTLSFEQAVVDDEIAAMIRRAQRGIRADDEALALALIEEIGLHGDFLGADHTRRHFREELLYPALAVRSNYARWAESGRTSLEERARARLADLMAAPREPLLSAGQQRELDAIQGHWLRRQGAGG